ncbi:MAG: putative polysaccharide biosynthesis protein [Methylocystaceae bacterium]
MVTKQSFIKGAAILAAAGALSKVLGALYRIPLARMIGGEGMGLYQMAYPIYTTILSLATAGVPVAISVLVARKEAQGYSGDSKRLMSLSLVLLGGVGLLLAIIVYLAAPWLATEVLHEPRAALAIAAIAPAIVFAALMAVLRGYFQGYQWMIPTAVSQVVEQVFRVILVLVLAFWLLPRGLAYAAAGATFGAVIGGVAGLSVLVGFYAWYQQHEKKNLTQYRVSGQNSKALAAEMIKLAIPVSLGSVVVPLVQMLDAIIVPGRLAAIGFTTARATELYGQLSGMASVLINLPTIFTISIATSLVPAVSEAIASQGKGLAVERINNGLRLAAIIAWPSAIGLFVLAGPIMDLLFATPEAGLPLMPLAFSILVLAVFQVTSSSLQALGRPDLPLKHLLITGIVKVVCNYTLTGVPMLNIVGPAIGTVLAFSIGSAFNYYWLKRITGMKTEKMRQAKIALAAIAMGVGVYYGFELLVISGLSSHLATLLAISAGAVVYGIMLFILGEFDRELIKRLLKR